VVVVVVVAVAARLQSAGQEWANGARQELKIAVTDSRKSVPGEVVVREAVHRAAAGIGGPGCSPHPTAEYG